MGQRCAKSIRGRRTPCAAAAAASASINVCHAAAASPDGSATNGASAQRTVLPKPLEEAEGAESRLTGTTRMSPDSVTRARGCATAPVSARAGGVRESGRHSVAWGMGRKGGACAWGRTEEFCREAGRLEALTNPCVRPTEHHNHLIGLCLELAKGHDAWFGAAELQLDFQRRTCVAAPVWERGGGRCRGLGCRGAGWRLSIDNESSDHSGEDGAINEQSGDRLALCRRIK